MKTQKTALLLFKIVILALVAWGITRAIQDADADLRAQQFSWRAVGYGWFVAAAIFYFVAQFPMSWFWQQTLMAFGQSPTWFDTFRAFFIGHLGKYVPGKILVIVLRSSLLGHDQTDRVLAGISVFVETLTSMACGACLAATILFFWFPDQVALQALAVGLMLGTVVGTLPPVMRRVVAWVQRRRGHEVLESNLQAINYALIGKGWLAAGCMWGLTTLTFWCVLRGLPTMHGLAFRLDLLVRLGASVCLAVVAGFVSLIPGGLGVREWVLNQLLAPEFGQATSLIAAIVLRLVMLLTELAGSTILYLGGRPRSAAGANA